MKMTIVKGNADRNSNEATAWHKDAPKLTRWVQRHIVNRDDRYGHYYQDKDGEIQSCAVPAQAEQAKSGLLSQSCLETHFRATETKHIIGVYSYGADKLGKWVGIDIDNHDDKADVEANRRDALHLFNRLTRLRVVCLLYESNGRGGFHLWVLFSTPISAAVRLDNRLAVRVLNHERAVLNRNGAVEEEWLDLPRRDGEDRHEPDRNHGHQTLELPQLQFQVVHFVRHRCSP